MEVSIHEQSESDEVLKLISEPPVISGMTSVRSDKELRNGNIPAFACGPLKKERYINDKMEEELILFKQEVEKRFLET